jgi:hypothetical protein
VLTLVQAFGCFAALIEIKGAQHRASVLCLSFHHVRSETCWEYGQTGL